jgi:hypothetical protein
MISLMIFVGMACVVVIVCFHAWCDAKYGHKHKWKKIDEKQWGNWIKDPCDPKKQKFKSTSIHRTLQCELCGEIKTDVETGDRF